MKGTYQRAHVKLPGFLAEGSGSLKLVVAFYLSLFSKSVVNIYSVTPLFLNSFIRCTSKETPQFTMIGLASLADHNILAILHNMNSIICFRLSFRTKVISGLLYRVPLSVIVLLLKLSFS